VAEQVRWLNWVVSGMLRAEERIAKAFRYRSLDNRYRCRNASSKCRIQHTYHPHHSFSVRTPPRQSAHRKHRATRTSPNRPPSQPSGLRHKSHWVSIRRFRAFIWQQFIYQHRSWHRSLAAFLAASSCIATPLIYRAVINLGKRIKYTYTVTY